MSCMGFLIRFSVEARTLCTAFWHSLGLGDFAEGLFQEALFDQCAGIPNALYVLCFIAFSACL